MFVCLILKIYFNKRLYNNLHSPASLKPGSTYHLFRDGIRPEWEHPENTEGGKWVIIPSPNKIDEMWESLLLCCIGETLCESEIEICGVVISVRKKQSKLSIWTKNSSPDMSKDLGYFFFQNFFHLLCQFSYFPLFFFL